VGIESTLAAPFDSNAFYASIAERLAEHGF
jgi:hypothetical protein